MSRRSIGSFAISWVVLSCLLPGQLRSDTHPQRDAQALEILARVVQAAGGAQALASVRDITESGEITFYWADEVKGHVLIRALGGSRFRMDADLPDGKLSWVAKEGKGSKKESGGKAHWLPLPPEDAINLGNLTFPLAHIGAAFTDVTTEVSFVGIEKRDGRSLYRIRVKGNLELVKQSSHTDSVTKDMLVDALTFEIVSVEDHPHPTHRSSDKSVDTTPRLVDFGDFRTVSGVRVPFSIRTRVHGQEMLQIRLSGITFNTDLSDQEFRP